MFRVRFAVVNGPGPIRSGVGQVTVVMGSRSGTGEETQRISDVAVARANGVATARHLWGAGGVTGSNLLGGFMRVTKRRVVAVMLLAILMLVLMAGTAWAGVDPSTTIDPKGATGKGIGDVAAGLNLLWVVIGAVLVIFMQAGFALVETGFCRAKHAAHVVSTNFAVFGLGLVGYFIVGYAIMFSNFSYPGYFGLDKGLSADRLIGFGDWTFLWGRSGFGLSGAAYSAATAAFFLYMVAFMDTTATIPTGAMAERWKWKAFVGWGLFCGAIFYPIFGGWTWGGGWLSQLGNNASLGFGYVDFAGSGVVHAMGGFAGLAGALVLGARLGKYGPDGKPRTLAAHNIPMAMLGTFILLFGWFGFNAASTFAATDVRFAVVAVNTAIAAAFGATIAMFWAMGRMKKPDPGMMANGMLAGLVAITAPCAFVQPWAAAVIGSIAGVLVIESIFFFERRGVDDPVGAISVHGVCGIWGVMTIGIFSDGHYGFAWNLTDNKYANGHGVTGILYGSGKFLGDGSFGKLGFGQLASQGIGALTIIFVMGGIAFAFFKIQNAIMKGGIRPDEATELAGLDRPEMGVLAYDNLQIREIDVVGADPSEDTVLVAAGESPDPTTGR
jgi:Amt family ammonium transporter